MIWHREEYIAHCNYEFTGKEMHCELFGRLVGLDEEWRRQGATEKEIALTAFGFDYVLKTFLAGNCFSDTGLKSMVLEENDEYVISKDEKGRTLKMCKKSASLPIPQDYPVKTMDDWLKIKHWYTFSENRVNREELLRQKALWEKGYLTIFFIPGGFDEPRQLMGEEALCMAYYEEPEMIQDMLETFTETTLKVMERVLEIVPIDNLVVHEDLAGKSGPLIGPNQIKEFIAPYYSQVWNCAKSHGTTLFSQDSDGNITAVIDSFMDCGVNCIWPCEPAAGMDMVQLRKKYGKKLYLKGGIDKHILRQNDQSLILKELEYKMSESMLGGGTIFALDHLIPNGVSIENYRYYVKKSREILNLPTKFQDGWGDMGF